MNESPSDAPQAPDPLEVPPQTAPFSLAICCRGFDTEEAAHALANVVGEFIRDLSSSFDLSGLDGVTLAYDHAQALLELDRGFSTTNRLTPSDGQVTGIAMTPGVIRNGIVKSHIVLHAPYIEPIANSEDPLFPLALHVLAHECAHVEITHKFDGAFPGVSLRHVYEDIWKAMRGQVIMACWEEYAATCFSAGYGKDQTEGYEDTFIKALVDTRGQANEFIKAYRTHGDVEQVLYKVYGAYGNLLKFAAYHLGNLDGNGVSPLERPKTLQALSNHWFSPCFERLHAACKVLIKDYGRWPDMSAFEEIGDLADEVVGAGGLHLRYTSSGRVNIDIPYTLDTI